MSLYEKNDNFILKNILDVELEKYAYISDDQLYRYTLWRRWGQSSKYACFIGLNPSVADAYIDDPTLKRCIDFSKSFGYDAVCLINLFAYRATNPQDMKKVSEPIGIENDKVIKLVTSYSEINIAAWGTLGIFKNRNLEVQDMIDNLHYLKLTKDKHPSHPLYLKKDLLPKLWIK